jgi:tetratricopeptide (TPR) repeat protein
VDSKSGAPGPRDLPFTIGALAFLGRVEEARALFESSLSDPESELASAARFFLGVGFCRQSNYEESRRYFFENLRLSRRARNPQDRFYAYQGLGFYRFFCGRFGSALASAREANLAALGCGFMWGKLVSSDLMGHSLVQTGEVSLGLKTLEQALTYAHTLGDGGNQQAIRVALACFQAQYGLVPDAVSVLETLERELRDQDTYSRAALLLEMARQYGLRGELQKAREALSRSSRFIYGSRNRRQSVLLNIRYASLSFLQGEPEQALNLLLNTDRELVVGVDNALEVEALGVKLKILRAAGALGSGRDSQEALESRIRFLTQYTGKGVSRRILTRGLPAAGTHGPGEDRLADLLDRVAGRKLDSGLLQEVADSHYWGLFYEVLGIARDTRTICVDALAGGVLGAAMVGSQAGQQAGDYMQAYPIPDSMLPQVLRVNRRAALAALLATPALAQQPFPSRYLRIIVPYPPGGSAEAQARMVGERMAGPLGQPVVIENKPGAGATIATAYVAQQPADGYTLLLASTSHTITPALYQNLSYDAVTSFAPLSLLSTSPLLLLVRPDGPATLAELIARAKARPGALTYSTSGIGASPHLSAELFRLMARIEVTHVPFNGSAPPPRRCWAGMWISAWATHPPCRSSRPASCAAWP